ncbi:hypothetical protein HDU76_006158 [Blyttiomyces sp. JEL0837]|nr:hypothetical protein HDU76_006158 [Blyttiomyces sp. JEL0837]
MARGQRATQHGTQHPAHQTTHHATNDATNDATLDAKKITQNEIDGEIDDDQYAIQKEKILKIGSVKEESDVASSSTLNAGWKRQLRNKVKVEGSERIGNDDGDGEVVVPVKEVGDWGWYIFIIGWVKSEKDGTGYGGGSNLMPERSMTFDQHLHQKSTSVKGKERLWSIQTEGPDSTGKEDTGSGSGGLITKAGVRRKYSGSNVEKNIIDGILASQDNRVDSSLLVGIRSKVAKGEMHELAMAGADIKEGVPAECIVNEDGDDVTDVSNNRNEALTRSTKRQCLHPNGSVDKGKRTERSVDADVPASTCDNDGELELIDMIGTDATVGGKISDGTMEKERVINGNDTDVPAALSVDVGSKREGMGVAAVEMEVSRAARADEKENACVISLEDDDGDGHEKSHTNGNVCIKTPRWIKGREERGALTGERPVLTPSEPGSVEIIDVEVEAGGILMVIIWRRKELVRDRTRVVSSSSVGSGSKIKRAKESGLATTRVVTKNEVEEAFILIADDDDGATRFPTKRKAPHAVEIVKIDAAKGGSSTRKADKRIHASSSSAGAKSKLEKVEHGLVSTKNYIEVHADNAKMPEINNEELGQSSLRQNGKVDKGKGKESIYAVAPVSTVNKPGLVEFIDLEAEFEGDNSDLNLKKSNGHRLQQEGSAEKRNHSQDAGEARSSSTGDKYIETASGDDEVGGRTNNIADKGPEPDAHHSHGQPIPTSSTQEQQLQEFLQYRPEIGYQLMAVGDQNSAAYIGDTLRMAFAKGPFLLECFGPDGPPKWVRRAISRFSRFSPEELKWFQRNQPKASCLIHCCELNPDIFSVIWPQHEGNRALCEQMRGKSDIKQAVEAAKQAFCRDAADYLAGVERRIADLVLLLKCAFRDEASYEIEYPADADEDTRRDLGPCKARVRQALGMS